MERTPSVSSRNALWLFLIVCFLFFSRKEKHARSERWQIEHSVIFTLFSSAYWNLF